MDTSNLPVYRGYTVNIRTGEFRRIDGGTPKVIYFQEPEGMKLLDAWTRTRNGKKVCGILPRFRRYTVDVRLKEFRKILRTKPSEFIPFDSPEGDELLVEWLQTPDGQAALAEGKFNL